MSAFGKTPRMLLAELSAPLQPEPDATPWITEPVGEMLLGVGVHLLIKEFEAKKIKEKMK